MSDELADLKTMRDINDYCVRKGIPSLAQGMIELPPPLLLRQIASKMVMEEDLHTVWAPCAVRESLTHLNL